jgi:hypothetical protein
MRFILLLVSSKKEASTGWLRQAGFDRLSHHSHRVSTGWLRQAQPPQPMLPCCAFRFVCSNPFIVMHCFGANCSL